MNVVRLVCEPLRHYRLVRTAQIEDGERLALAFRLVDHPERQHHGIRTRRRAELRQPGSDRPTAAALAQLRAAAWIAVITTSPIRWPRGRLDHRPAAIRTADQATWRTLTGAGP